MAHAGRSTGVAGICSIVAAAFAGCASTTSFSPLDALPRITDAVSDRSRGDSTPAVRDDASIGLDDRSTLSDYLAYAALNNPGLEAAFNRWRAALERAPQVSSLPEPRLTYRYFIREVETRVGPQQQGVGVMQTFPWFGKLSLRGDIASEAAEAARQRYEAEKLKLFYEVKDGYYEYYYLSRSIDVVRETRNLVKRLEGVARTKYKTASASQAEVIRAQVELGKLEDALQTLLDRRSPVVARLNAALSRPIEQGLPEPMTIPEESIGASDEQVLAWALDGNPELAALDHEIASARRSISLAEKEYFPDITLGIDYTDVGSPPRMTGPGLSNPAALRGLARITEGMGDAIDLFSIGKSFEPGRRPDDAGKDIWMLSVSMDLPIRYSKYAASEREARARHRAAVSAKAARVNALGARIKSVLYEYRDAERKIDLYRDTLVPKARQSLNATEAGYGAGNATFLDLVDAERVLLDFWLAHERARANRAQRLAELDMLVGGTIPRKQQPVDGAQNLGPDENANQDALVTP